MYENVAQLKFPGQGGQKYSLIFILAQLNTKLKCEHFVLLDLEMCYIFYQ